jgi:hypothetical protein
MGYIILLWALIGISVYAFLIRNKFYKTSQEYKEVVKRFEAYKETTKRQAKADKKRIEELAKYQHIIDVEEAAAKIKRDALNTRERVKREALEHRDKIQAECRQMIDSANKSKAEIEQQELESQQRAESHESVVKAMQNIINGYGDEYLSPNRPVIDELAEEYAFHEAGNKLKEAKKAIKKLIKKGQAAQCDYIEDYRKATAIEFVLDSFNGKVDAIISRIKPHNHDKLEEQILDAYSVVNHNGKAFRNARITKAYLNATLEQLKCAAIVQKVKQRDKEEQQQIKEQMREEARAKKEYEKALKEAEKEEKIIQKAMREAEEKLLLAADEERSKYEDEISELRANLEEALARSERSISMAQQTKQGHVYIISNMGSFGEDVFKVGLTRRLEPMERVKELGDASVPFEFDVHAMVFSSDAPALEKKLHELLEANRVNKVNHRKEFFRVPISEIKQAVEEAGYTVQWTLRAEATEYRESCRLEKFAGGLLEEFGRKS